MQPEQVHLHRRKRIHKRHAPYPHPQKGVRWLDNLVSVVSVIFPLSTLPQLYEIWVRKQTAGVSLLTWSGFLLMQIPLFVYAVVHKEKRLQVMFGLWCMLQAGVVLGILLYR
jgi:hypothetical protein